MNSLNPTRLNRHIAHQKLIRTMLNNRRPKTVSDNRDAMDRLREEIGAFVEKHRHDAETAMLEANRLNRCLRVLRNAISPPLLAKKPLAHLNPYEVENTLVGMIDRALDGERL